MFPKAVLAALLWAVVSGQSKPRPCCTDHQFEMTLGEVAGSFFSSNGLPSSSILTGDNTLHFDEYRKKAVVVSRLVDLKGNRIEVNVFIDFNTNKQFVQFANGSCVSIPAYQILRSPCVPANATFVGSSDFGYGPNMVEVNNFQVTFPPGDTTLRIAVTKYGCIPMVESFYGHKIPQPDGKLAAIDLVFLITNFKPGLSQPALFDIFPTNCQGASSDEAIPEHTRRAIHAFNLMYAN
ncbi:uncharacterized protein LOC121380140 [Gigantopelta aegis]|uniref:uncharacterized protein LOC121380140 n=1 Tax=Gigantopelta aegis TaxID=1735272 RepID=UPI001B88BB4F|nr:uncharacterized protein LOC121380140 [Gigantopelta aegis]